jgi:pyruvate dehydrogenase E2 component (dihydrolipoamide acetyltransferase)
MADIINMPKLGFDMAEGTLIRWVKKVGDTVNKGEILAEIETDKATVEVESSASGVVRSLLADEGSVVPVNTPIAIVGTPDEKIEAPQTPKDASNKLGSENSIRNEMSFPGMKPSLGLQVDSHLKVSPIARRLALEKRVDLSKIKGTGPGGRIVRRDIESELAGETLAADQEVKPLRASALFATQGPSLAVDEKAGMSKLRQAIARRMLESKTTIPHFYLTHEYKVDALLELRTHFNMLVPELEKISVNDFIIKAVALSLRQFPNLNASLNGNLVVRHGQINIGVAVSIEGGLLTVVCNNADVKPVRQIASEVKAMAERARSGKVKPQDIEGSTFSISNLGMYEVENFIAILNPPEAAILAVGTAKEVPVVDGGVVKSGWRMKATISVDHRVSDGAEAARFMQVLGVFLEEPLQLII